jgi:hypothetical protein
MVRQLMAVKSIPCPVCGADGAEVCIKGDVGSDRWQFKEPLGQNHADRIEANKWLRPKNENPIQP